MFDRKKLAIIGLLIAVLIACFAVVAMADADIKVFKVLGTIAGMGSIGVGMAMGATETMSKAAKSTAAIATQYLIAKHGADDDTYSQASAATDTLVGVFQHITSAAGDSVRIMKIGISPVKLGGTVTRGDPLTSDANGKAVTATLGQNVLGYATISGVLNDVGFVFISPGILNSALGVDGNTFKGVARATFDATAGKAIASHGLGVTLPDNAIITRSWYEVITTFTSATDAATIALGIPTDDVAGIKAAIAISNGANPWDAGLVEGIQDGTAAAFTVKTTAARELTADVAVEALTAGVAILFCEYVISG